MFFMASIFHQTEYLDFTCHQFLDFPPQNIQPDMFGMFESFRIENKCSGFEENLAEVCEVGLQRSTNDRLFIFMCLILSNILIVITNILSKMHAASLYVSY